MTPYDDPAAEEPQLTALSSPDGVDPKYAGRVLQVVTASGAVYQLDLAQWRLTRYRNKTDPADDALPSAQLRRDGDRLRLISLARLEVGDYAVFALEPLGGPTCVLTTRRTTRIVSITDWPDTGVGPNLAEDPDSAAGESRTLP